MRIDRPNVSPPTDTKPRTATGTDAPAKAVATNDTSSVVKLAAGAPQEKSAVDPVIASRIEKVRSLLAKGTYPIDLDRLASRIVDDEGDRTGPRGGKR
jgi:flagellar biosynthesis anti-sigma factor FlgM